LTNFLSTKKFINLPVKQQEGTDQILVTL